MGIFPTEKVGVYSKYNWACFLHMGGHTSYNKRRRIAYIKVGVYRTQRWACLLHKDGRGSYIKRAFLLHKKVGVFPT